MSRIQALAVLAMAIMAGAGCPGPKPGVPPVQAIKKGDLPEGTKCGTMGVGGEECTTPDGKRYYCDRKTGECEEVPDDPQT